MISRSRKSHTCTDSPLPAITAIKARAPVLGGNFGVWGGMFSTFDCAVKGIRKKEDPKSFEDFKTISLCTCIYKIIAKVIATHLNHFLSKKNSMEQFGFLDGRKIHEEVGVAQETLYNLKRSRKKGAIVKIDLSKAYDRII